MNKTIYYTKILFNLKDDFFLKIQDLLAYEELVPLFAKYQMHHIIKFVILSDWKKLRTLGISFLKNLTDFDIDLILDLDNIVKNSPHYKSKF